MSLKITQIDKRKIVIGGIGKMLYQDGFPLSMAVSELKGKGLEISCLHMVEEFWDNGWSWQTIERKLRGEIEDCIAGEKIDIDFVQLELFYRCLDQPRRSNGGYEESREIIFQYLFCEKSSDVIAKFKNGKRDGNSTQWFQQNVKPSANIENQPKNA